eukprot:g42622.t1
MRFNSYGSTFGSEDLSAFEPTAVPRPFTRPSRTSRLATSLGALLVLLALSSVLASLLVIDNTTRLPQQSLEAQLSSSTAHLPQQPEEAEREREVHAAPKHAQQHQTSKLVRMSVRRHSNQRSNSNFYRHKERLSAWQLSRFDAASSDWDEPPGQADDDWNAGWLMNESDWQPWTPWYYPADEAPLGTDMSLVAYSLQLAIGKPPQNLTVVMDTGSGNLEVNGAMCITCQSPHRYDPLQSRTASKVPCFLDEDCACVPQAQCYCNAYSCSFDIIFADQTGRLAHLLMDNVELAGFHVSTSIGVVYEQKGSFGAVYDGTMGFAYGNRLMVRGSNWLDDLYREQGIDKVFSLCMGIHGGQLAVGGLDPKLYFGEIMYTPIVNTGFYTVVLQTIEIHTHSGWVQSVSIMPQQSFSSGTIIDTGSTIMHLSPDNYDPLVKALNNLCRQSGGGWLGICDKSSNESSNIFTIPDTVEDRCVSLPRAQMILWPQLVLNFMPEYGGKAPTRVLLEPHHYLYPLTLGPGSTKTDADPENNMWCLGFARDTFIRAVYLVHDVPNMRVGFAVPNKQNCGPNAPN